jgi:homoserine dehydrogenase
MDKIKVGMIGLGTVGSGVLKTLSTFEQIEVVKVAVKNINKKREINLSKSILTDNPYEVVNHPDIQIVIEVIGGVKPALDLIKTAIKNGKHIVTANKELLAKHGEELFSFAEENNKVILYEAAIAGGIPIIMPTKTILAGNKITKIAAILNGTTNYILTKMDIDGASYKEVLSEAQELGYAETDPTGDVEGFDAAYKIATLSTIAFNKRINIKNIYREGISKIQAEDMRYANEFGFKIKLIALAQIDENNNADVRVHPMLVKKTKSLANIDYVTNAITFEGHPVGEIMFSGAGAGEFPTASSVVGDVLVIVTELPRTDYPLPMMRCKHKEAAKMIDISQTYNKYYLSINAKNNVGVIALLGSIFAENDISISSLLQKGLRADNTANIIVITESCNEQNMQNAIKMLSKDDSINKINSLIRVME